MHEICDSLSLDRSTLWQCSDDASCMVLTHIWSCPEARPPRRNFDATTNFPWIVSKIMSGQAVQFASLRAMPAEATRDLETLRSFDAKAFATFPLIADGHIFGALSFGTTREEHQWADSELAGLNLISQIIGNVISRHRAEERVEQLRGEIQNASRAAILGELAVTLAHEINQPLGSILNNAHATRLFLEQGTAPASEILLILNDIIRDGKRAGDIVRNLRAMLSNNLVPRDLHCLNTLVVDVCTFLGAELAAAKVAIHLDLAKAMPPVVMARTEIQQLLLNLLTNAVQALEGTPEAQRTIEITTRYQAQHLVLSVRDSGDGIAPNHIDHIFEPFHTTRRQGLGMGLAICRRIAQSHGGKLEVRNNRQAGAEFLFTMPVSASTASVSPTDSA